MAKNNNEKIGGLWVNTSKKGDTYLSGSVELGGTATKIVVFKNTFKKDGENTPDYRIYLSSSGDGGSSAPAKSDEKLPF